MKIALEKSFITYDLAEKLIKPAIDQAKKLKIAIAVAITDPTGHLVAFAKMDDACLIAIGTAQGKAYTAARSGLNTRDLMNYFKENNVDTMSLQAENLMLIPGGSPIMYDGKLIGGIGIGGGTGEQDEECVQAALGMVESLSDI